MATTECARGRLALCSAHVAGMVDMVALPVWVGSLISGFGFSPARAGGLASIFLIGVVVASLYLAPRFNRMNARILVPIGFIVCGVLFLLNIVVDQYEIMGIFHFLGGLALGCALSLTHGTVGRSTNPHRTFALLQFANGVFAIGFMGSVPLLIHAYGAEAMYYTFAAIMCVAALLTGCFFPAQLPTPQPKRSTAKSHGSLPVGVWFGIAGVSVMAITQSMMFSFLERVGSAKGFSVEQLASMFVILGFVNLAPAALAAVLEKRFKPHLVMQFAPLFQIGLALLIVYSGSFYMYAAAGAFYPFIMIFTHTFAFGLFAKLDPSGRVVSSTPAINMLGASIGPFLGGVLVQEIGYGALPYAVSVLALVAMLSFFMIGRHIKRNSPVVLSH
ncbi:MFS transporter [Oceanobacter antarcticus]|uniref:MFS transporter n=1 Tax=Oceanobacter antarcticus TaxID=3133425 RepID=A0ABW8NPB2_9GAMM